MFLKNPVLRKSIKFHLTSVFGALALLLIGFLAIQVDHPKPADDYFCTHSTHAPEDHQCACVKTCTKDENGNVVVQEDPKCKVWCFKDHCNCEAPCQMTN